MAQINCIVVDDEPLALKLISSFVERTPFLQLQGAYISPTEAIGAVTPQTDVVFLDIHMPELSGIELARALPPGVKIVFTTAYREYALESYAVHAADYLLKPLSYSRFLETATRLRNMLTSSAAPKTDDAEPASDSPDYIFVKSDYRFVRIDLQSFQPDQPPLLRKICGVIDPRLAVVIAEIERYRFLGNVKTVCPHILGTVKISLYFLDERCRQTGRFQQIRPRRIIPLAISIVACILRSCSVLYEMLFRQILPAFRIKDRCVVIIPVRIIIDPAFRQMVLIILHRIIILAVRGTSPRSWLSSQERS